MATEMAVNALLHQRARLRGDKETKQNRLRALNTRIAAAEQALQALKAQADTLASAIAQLDADAQSLTEALVLAFGHDADDGCARKTYPKTHRARWGGLTRTVLAILRETGTATADQLTDEVAQRIHLTFDEATPRRVFRRQMSRTLKNMAQRGLIQGHHNRSVGAHASGIWSLTASDA